MRTLILSLLVTSVLFTPLQWCLAQPLRNTDKTPLPPASIDQLIAVSGLPEQMEEIPKAMAAGYDKGMSETSHLNPEFKINLKDAMTGGFSGPAMVSVVKNELTSSLTENDIRILLKWFNSKEGKIVTKAEIENSSTASVQNMMENAQQLMADHPQLVKRAVNIEELIKSSEMGVAIHQQISLSMYTAFTFAKDPTSPVDIASFNTQMYKMSHRIRAQSRDVAILSIVNNYKDLDLELVDQYTDFLKTETARKFTKAIIRGMTLAFDKGFSYMEDRLKEILAKVKEEAKAKASSGKHLTSDK